MRTRGDLDLLDLGLRAPGKDVLRELELDSHSLCKLLVACRVVSLRAMGCSVCTAAGGVTNEVAPAHSMSITKFMKQLMEQP